MNTGYRVGEFTTDRMLVHCRTSFGDNLSLMEMGNVCVNIVAMLSGCDCVSHVL